MATSQETAVPTDEASLNELLSSDIEGVTTETVTETPTPEPEETEAVESTDDESTDADETSEADEDAGTEDEPEADPLELKEDERDYTDAVYERYAKHFSRTHKVQYDISDPVHRAALREMIQRGEDFKARQAEEATAKAEEPKKAEEAAKDQVADKPATPENIAEVLANVEMYAEQRIVPEVAKAFANEFVNALWPDKEIKMDAKQERNITKAFTKFGYMLIRDALPSIMQYVPQQVEAAYPYIGKAHDEGVRAEALERLDTRIDPTTKLPAFPDLEEMVSSGAVARVMKSNPWIVNVSSDKDPVKRQEAQLEAAIKMARGERINPAVVEKAVQRGKEQATRAAKVVGASKLAAGNSRGAFTPGEITGESLVKDMLPDSGSKFSAAVAKSRANRK